MAKDYYDTLGIAKTASADEIKSAYRKLAKQFHPDVFATAEASKKAEAEAKFKEIQHAYDILSDPQKKSTYDQFGSEDPQQSGFGGQGGFNPFGGQGGGGFEDIFSNIFDAFGSGGRTSSRTVSNEREGEDIEIQLTLTFSEACFGVEKELTYNRTEKCSSCGGSGAKGGTAFKTCTKCGGKGRILVNQRTFLGMMQSERVCDMCNGKGKIVTDKCLECNGKGVNNVRYTKKIKIPGGVNNGQMLTLRGEGNAGTANAPYGNLIVVFKVSPHPLFIRKDTDLSFELPITIMQALLGDTVEIPTLLKTISIDIPEGATDGMIIRVKNKGIKFLNKEAFGDMYVKLVIDIPKHLTAKQKREIEELKSVFNESKHDKIEKYNKLVKGL